MPRRRATRAGGAAAVSLAIALTAAACGSVPDLVFVDDVLAEAGAPEGGDGGAPGPLDAGVEAAPSSCVAGPSDVCCGERLCQGCTQADCTECAACSAQSTFCCKRANGLQCRVSGTCS